MNNITEKEGITDARELGIPKYIILGVQHLFAMFGATILVPVKIKSVHGKEKR